VIELADIEAARARIAGLAVRTPWMARALGVPATIVVPDHAPEAKLAAIERLGGRAGTEKVVCVVSGGNINLSKLGEILGGAAG
jgi:threonine dehydratase